MWRTEHIIYIPRWVNSLWQARHCGHWGMSPRITRVTPALQWSRHHVVVATHPHIHLKTHISHISNTRTHSSIYPQSWHTLFIHTHTKSELEKGPSVIRIKWLASPYHLPRALSHKAVTKLSSIVDTSRVNVRQGRTQQLTDCVGVIDQGHLCCAAQYPSHKSHGHLSLSRSLIVVNCSRVGLRDTVLNRSQSACTITLSMQNVL